MASLVQGRSRGGDYASLPFLIGWGLAQFPYLVVPDITVSTARAPEPTLRLLVLALGIGAIVLFPSLAYLFYVFKADSASHPDRSRD